MKRTHFNLLIALAFPLVALQAEPKNSPEFVFEEELEDFLAEPSALESSETSLRSSPTSDFTEVPYEDSFLVESEETEAAIPIEDLSLSQVPTLVESENEMKPVIPAPTAKEPAIALAPAKAAAPANPIIEKIKPEGVQISLKQVFSGSPVIYSLLFLMSVSSLFIWFYTQANIRFASVIPESLLSNLRNKLNSNQYDEAVALCRQHDNFFCKMIAAGIASRKNGLQVMTDTMKTEGKRATVRFWQKIALLNDIAIIAPMIGLLGTVLGMFYAFYDLNRSMESMNHLFDGLGVSVGTTVAGLIVAIVAMILHSLVKYRLTRLLSVVENEAHSLASLIDSKASLIQDK